MTLTNRQRDVLRKMAEGKTLIRYIGHETARWDNDPYSTVSDYMLRRLLRSGFITLGTSGWLENRAVTYFVATAGRLAIEQEAK